MKVNTQKPGLYESHSACATDNDIRITVARDGLNSTVHIRTSDFGRFRMSQSMWLTDEQAVALHQMLTDALNSRNLHDDDRANLPLPEVTEVES